MNNTRVDIVIKYGYIFDAIEKSEKIIKKFGSDCSTLHARFDEFKNLDDEDQIVILKKIDFKAKNFNSVDISFIFLDVFETQKDADRVDVHTRVAYPDMFADVVKAIDTCTRNEYISENLPLAYKTFMHYPLKDKDGILLIIKDNIARRSNPQDANDIVITFLNAMKTNKSRKYIAVINLIKAAMELSNTAQIPNEYLQIAYDKFNELSLPEQEKIILKIYDCPAPGNNPFFVVSHFVNIVNDYKTETESAIHYGAWERLLIGLGGLSVDKQYKIARDFIMDCPIECKIGDEKSCKLMETMMERYCKGEPMHGK